MINESHPWMLEYLFENSQRRVVWFWLDNSEASIIFENIFFFYLVLKIHEKKINFLFKFKRVLTISYIIIHYHITY